MDYFFKAQKVKLTGILLDRVENMYAFHSKVNSEPDFQPRASLK